MASCEFSKYVGGDCGASLVLPSGDLCVRISECSKDIKGHLKTYGVSDGTQCSEATLLLARNVSPKFAKQVQCQHVTKYLPIVRYGTTNCSSQGTIHCLYWRIDPVMYLS